MRKLQLPHSFAGTLDHAAPGRRKRGMVLAMNGPRVPREEVRQLQLKTQSPLKLH